VYSPTSYIANPSPSPIHAWNGSTCVLISKTGTSGGAFLTAKHTGGSASVNVNGSGEGTAYNITARYEHPTLDAAILVSDADLSALPTVTLANAQPDKTGTVPIRMGGWGRTQIALGFSYIFPRAERWVRGYSVDRNIQEAIKPYECSLRFDEAGALSNTGVACVNDSGGGFFSNDDYTLYGIILGVDGDGNYGTTRTNGISAVSLRSWIQSILGNPSAKFITVCYLDVVNLRARLVFSEAVDWISPGGKLYIEDHDGTAYVDTGAIYGGGSATGVTFIDVVIEAATVGERESESGGSAPQTFDLMIGAFSIGGVGNVAVTESLVLDFAEGTTVAAPIPLGFTVKLGSSGGSFSNFNGEFTETWDENVTDSGFGLLYIGDPFGREMSALATGAPGGTSTFTTTAVARTGSARTAGTFSLEAQHVDGSVQPNDALTSGVPITWDAGTNLTVTNGAASVTAASLNSATNKAIRYRSFQAPYSGVCTITTGGTGGSDAALESRCFTADGTLMGSAVTGSTPISFQAISGTRYIFGHYNSGTGSLSVSSAVAFPVGTPSATGANVPTVTQTTSGLVLQRNGNDDSSVDYFRITNITGGTLYQNNGSTVINSNDYITYAQGQAGLKFTPSTTAGGSFRVYGSRSNDGLQLSTGFATATITVGSGNARWRSSPRAGRCR
jgi:hypothetical protein